jgi:chemotaxis protein MotA
VDFATPLGIVVALAAILVSSILEGGNPAVLLFPPAIVLVIGGALGVGLASNRLGDMAGVVKATISALKPSKGPDGAATITELMGFAEVARQDGLLALEEKVKTVEDPFLRRGLELVVDGTDRDEVADSLGQEIEAMRERHKVAAKYYADMGAYAPTIGIIGTVMGLAHALEKLDDPAKLGHSIAAALMATLWGVLSANVFFLPVSGKLKRMSAVEVAQRQLVIEGVLAIQAGVSPRALSERLKSHLAPRQRDGVGGKKAEEKANA